MVPPSNSYNSMSNWEKRYQEIQVLKQKTQEVEKKHCYFNTSYSQVDKYIRKFKETQNEASYSKAIQLLSLKTRIISLLKFELKQDFAKTALQKYRDDVEKLETDIIDSPESYLQINSLMEKISDGFSVKSLETADGQQLEPYMMAARLLELKVELIQTTMI